MKLNPTVNLRQFRLVYMIHHFDLAFTEIIAVGLEVKFLLFLQTSKKGTSQIFTSVFMPCPFLNVSFLFCCICDLSKRLLKKNYSCNS